MMALFYIRNPFISRKAPNLASECDKLTRYLICVVKFNLKEMMSNALKFVSTRVIIDRRCLHPSKHLPKYDQIKSEWH
jgi:hypothetical protein